MSIPDLPTDNAIDKILSLSQHREGLISILYNNICDIIPDSLQDVKRFWEDNLVEEMTADQWEREFDIVHTSSPCARHNLT